VVEEGITWNYTTWLNIAFLILAAVLVVRFVRTGGIAMLRMMGGSPNDAAEHDHSHHIGHSHHPSVESDPNSESSAGHEHGRHQP
jgi:hypothetical protein